MVKSLQERFWAKVNKTNECWVWTGSTFRKGGYGYFLANATRTERLARQSHRVAWELATGMPIPDDMVIGHICDNPPCVRNDERGTYVVGDSILPRVGHLFLGTVEDNRLDMMAKGRSYAHAGEKAGPSRLTAIQVLEIRRQWSEGRLQREIAATFGVSQGNVSHIVHDHTWRTTVH